MSRFRLRYKSTNLELFPGEFTIGRSSACSLALADGLVSRRHAVLRVGPSEVTVEDIGSRNGLLVNGKPSEGPCRLSHMDRIFIGAQELVLIDSARVSSLPKVGTSVICDACGAINGSSRRRCGDCGERLNSEAANTYKQPPHSSSIPHTWGGSGDTRTETTRDVIDGIAAKAVDLGRFEEAERILVPHLGRLMERALSGQPLSRSGRHDADALLARATGNALELALGLDDGKWIDWVFRIHTATGRLMPAETIETLRAVVRSQRYDRQAYVRAYLKVIRRRADEWTEPEQLRVRRLVELANEIIGR